MNKLHLGLAVIIGAVVLGSVFAFTSVLSQKADQNLGTSTVTASNALNQQRLITELTAIAAPLQNIGNGTTAMLTWPALATSTLSQSTTTSITGVAGALGDFVIVSPVNPVSGATFLGQVTTASTTTATFTIVERLSDYVAAASATTTFNVLVMPATSFKAVTGL